MKYERFEDLPVWKAAIELKLGVDGLVRDRRIRAMRSWIDQIDRASLSVSNNVAEGFERGTTNELLAFLYIARGSAGEVRSMLRYLVQKIEADAAFEISNLKSRASASQASASEISNLKSEISNLESEISDLKSQIVRLIDQAEGVSRQLRGWAGSLQDGSIKGQRHLNSQSRARFAQERRAEQFRERIRRDYEARFGNEPEK